VNRLRKEFDVFRRCPRSMQILMLSNMIYSLVLPVIEIFVAAYVMRNSHAVGKVVTYQLAVYTATPVAFFLNGILLGRVGAKHLYAAGMLLSGVAMMMMMGSSVLTLAGIATSGLLMGLSTGLFWANRGFLALATTNDSNRNYYYGVELFFAALASVAIPALIGWFISGATLYGWLGGRVNRAYQIIAMVFLGLTAIAAGILERGTFRNPARTRFVFFRFHPLWRQMLKLALLKGLAQGYILTAPAMLIMLFVGQEGTLGATQAIGGVFSACLLYTAGRITGPRHRQLVFATGLVLFFLGAAAQLYFKPVLGPLQRPGIAKPQPLVGRLDLPSVANLLIEDSVFVADAIADCRNVQGGQRIHEAGGKPAQPTIAQPRLFLLFDQNVQVNAQLSHGLLGLVVDSQIDQVVREMRPGKEFRRQVTDHAYILRLIVLYRRYPPLQYSVAHRVCQRQIEVIHGCPLDRPALHKKQVIQKRLSKRLGTKRCSLTLLRSRMRQYCTRSF
jgi:YQGE family putative transporter